MGVERAASYYDDVMTRGEFVKPFWRSPRLGLWAKVVGLISYPTSILDIGCGPGQFAAFLYACGFRDYLGVDFSEQVISLARDVAPPEMLFRLWDIRNGWIGEKRETVVACEVLEHVGVDLDVLDAMPEGTSVVFSVPKFDDPSHVRHFYSSGRVIDRYCPFLSGLVVEEFGEFFVGRGYR